MRPITIYTNGDIVINGNSTGWKVFQEKEETAVYRWQETKEGVAELVSIPMPSRRYALSCDNPASGRPGRSDFDNDLLEVMAKYSTPEPAHEDGQEGPEKHI